MPERFLKLNNKIVGVLVFCLITVFLLVEVFPGKIILSQNFNLGPLVIHYYGLLIAAAIVSAYYLAKSRIQEIGLTVNQLENTFLVVAVTGFIGARLYHVFSSFGYYSTYPLKVLYVWNGGLSIFGAVIGGLIGIAIAARIWIPEIRIARLLDFLIPSVVLGQIIGRFGNLFNYEAYGLPTNLPWKMFVPQVFRIPPYELNGFFHPLFLYESAAGLLILLILLRYSNPNNRLKILAKAGSIFGLWLILYGLVRFGTELLRVDSPHLFGIKQNLITAGLMVLIGAVILFKNYNEA